MGVIGLDYGAVKLIAEALDIRFDISILRKLRMLETEVLKSLNRETNEKGSARNEFCRACRAAKKNVDCAHCDTSRITVEVLEKS